MKNIAMAKAYEDLKEDSNIVLLDVRADWEFEAGHIEGAINVPVMALEEMIEEVVPNKEEVLYIYCRSGVRVLTAGDILENLGYQNVYNMGGILAWPYEIVK